MGTTASVHPLPVQRQDLQVAGVRVCERMQGENGSVEHLPPPLEASHQEEDAEGEDDKAGPRGADIEQGPTQVALLPIHTLRFQGCLSCTHLGLHSHSLLFHCHLVVTDLLACIPAEGTNTSSGMTCIFLSKPAFACTQDGTRSVTLILHL